MQIIIDRSIRDRAAVGGTLRYFHPRNSPARASATGAQAEKRNGPEPACARGCARMRQRAIPLRDALIKVGQGHDPVSPPPPAGISSSSKEPVGLRRSREWAVTETKQLPSRADSPKWGVTTRRGSTPWVTANRIQETLGSSPMWVDSLDSAVVSAASL